MLLGERIKDYATKPAGPRANWPPRSAPTPAKSAATRTGASPPLDVIARIARIARIAKVLNISVDHLVFEDIPRRPLHGPDHGLGDRLGDIGELNAEDRAHLLSVIDAFVTKDRLHALAGGSTNWRHDGCTMSSPG
jgi:hypothetical protein